MKEYDIGNHIMIPEIHKLDKKTIISKLAEFFELQAGVELAYLFGSTAEDNRGLSDIDVDVYLSGRLTKMERIEKRLKLAAGLAGFLRTDRFNLIIMNDAASVITLTPMFYGEHIIGLIKKNIIFNSKNPKAKYTII